MSLVISVEDAETYFDTRLNSGPWDDISDSANEQKTAALTTAQNQLEVYYTLDASSELCRNAVCEQALFLLIGGEDMEKRALLIRQGVSKAGIVEEDYRKDSGKLAICPFAQSALVEFTRPGSGKCFVVPINRDDSNYVTPLV